MTLPLGGSVKAIIPTMSAIQAKIGVILIPQRQFPARIATPDPTMYPSPLLKI